MKRNIIEFLYLIIGLFVYLIILPRPASAVGDFQADYEVQYAISPTGVTIVTQNVTLTNLQSNLYPQKYAITIDSVKIANVIAYDKGGVIKTAITQKGGKTDILLPFNEKVVGLGRQLHFSLRYENGDVAAKNGSIWEVNVPGIANDPDIATYNVTLSVPSAFGQNAYIAPLPASGTRWTKEQMMTGGISAAYGDTQTFDIRLSYYIENPTITRKTTQIALPPNTAYQRIVIDSLEPAPKTVLTDGDGNWLARYELSPGEQKEIQLAATARIGLVPDGEFIQKPPDTKEYLKPQKYWETTNPTIVNIAATRKTPREIYDYVVQALSYDYSRVEKTPLRKGAIGALAAPENSLCTEFTDLFIATARAAGIPAREAVGYAYTTNGRLRPLSLVADVLHAWPEYYDAEKNAWIPVDPTWADTTGGVNYFDKLDFNHIVFAYHGTTSDDPLPAGFYKKPGKKTKDVIVAFAQKTQQPPTPRLAVTYEFPENVSSGSTTNGSVLITNRGGIQVKQSFVTVESSPPGVAIAKTIENLPPFGTVSLPISITIPNFIEKREGAITTRVGDETFRHAFTISPVSYRFLIPIGMIVAAAIGMTAIIIGPKILWKQSKKP